MSGHVKSSMRLSYMYIAILQTHVKVAEIPGTGGIRGLVAMRRLIAGQVALSVPKHLVISLGSHKRTLPVRGQAFHTAAPSNFD